MAKEIGIYGVFDPANGYGRGTIALAKTALLAGYDVRACPIRSWWDVGKQAQDPIIQSIWDRDINPKTILAHCSPPQLLGPNHNRTLLVYTMWESAKLPQSKDHEFGDWKWILQNANISQIFTPSHFVQQLFIDEGFTNTEMLPYLMQFHDIDFVEKKPTTVFKVLIAGDLVGRKGVDLAIKAWQLFRDRRPDIKTTLTIKARHKNATTVFDDPDVTVITDTYSREQMIKLYQDHDCFLWLSKGEGLSLPPMEATMAGTAIVCAYNTGMKDWLSWGVICDQEDEWFIADVESAANDLGCFADWRLGDLEMYQERVYRQKRKIERTYTADRAIRAFRELVGPWIH